MGISYDILIHAQLEGWHEDDAKKYRRSPAIDFLNDHRKEIRHYGLYEIMETRDTDLGYSGEGKGTGHFAGSAKNLDVELFKQFIDEAPWEWREQVVVIISEDAGDTTEIYRPAPLKGKSP